MYTCQYLIYNIYDEIKGKFMYKFFMRVYEGKKIKTITAKIDEDQLEIIDEVARRHDRSRSYVIRELLVRGLVQYKIDGNLKITGEEENLLLLEKKTKTQQAGKKDVTAITLEEAQADDAKKNNKKRK
jgi:superfamily II DNA helicase RecQ